MEYLGRCTWLSRDQASGRTIPHQFVARRPGDIAACYADPSKAKRELGWVAQRGVAEMCADTWRWQSANPKGHEKSSFHEDTINDMLSL